MTRILRRDSGLIATSKLHEIGFSNDGISGLIKYGALIRLHRGVYADGRTRLHPRAHLKAALMSFGDEAFLSGRTAAAGWGLRTVNVREIEITVASARTPHRPGLVVHRTSREPGPIEVRNYQGLRLSSVPRMLVELAERETPTELTRLVTAAIRLGFLDIWELEHVLDIHRRKPGSERLRQTLAAYRPGPDRKSSLERAFDLWLQRHPEIPEPVRNVRLGPWEIDCWWPERRLALELDGRPYHVAVTDMERDRAKDIWLQLRGIAAMRVTGERFEHAGAAVLDDLIGMLGTRSTPGRHSTPSNGRVRPG